MFFSPSSVILVAAFSSMASGLSIPRAESTACRIQLSQGSTPLKYLSSQLNEFGEYGILTDSATQALEVTFNTGNNSEQMDLQVTGTEGGMPMMGGITGFFNEGDDLVSGSYNYAYIGLTSQTPSGSIPQSGANSFDKINNYSRKIESAIWLFDVATRQVVPQWVNTNKSTPKNFLVYVDKQNVLVITADKDRFLEEFGEEFEVQGANPVEVNMRCVE